MLALLTVITIRLTTCKQIRKFLTGDDGTLFWSRSLWSVFSVDVTGSLCIILCVSPLYPLSPDHWSPCLHSAVSAKTELSPPALDQAPV